MNTTQGYYCYCPVCGIYLSISPNLMNVTHLKCLTCGSNFKNPYKVHAGNDKPSFSIGKMAIIITLFFIGLANWINFCSSPSESNTSGSSLYYVQDDTYAATSQSAWDAVGRYSVANDTEAIQRLINRGDVIFLTKGEEVYLEKNKFSYSIVRRKGSTQQLWVHIEHIKQYK